MADEPQESRPASLDPRHVRHVAEEPDVGTGGVLVRRRQRSSPVEQLEVITADEPGDEDRVLAGAGVLSPYNPRDRGGPRRQRARRDARVLGVVGRIGVQRTAILRAHRRGAGTEAGGRLMCRAYSSGRRSHSRRPASGTRRRRLDRRGSWPRTSARCRADRGRWKPVSYHTTQATLSLGPVKAMSGSIPLRLGSMLSAGSPTEEDPPQAARRSAPTCCQQKKLTLVAADGLNPAQRGPDPPGRVRRGHRPRDGEGPRRPVSVRRGSRSRRGRRRRPATRDGARGKRCHRSSCSYRRLTANRLDDARGPAATRRRRSAGPSASWIARRSTTNGSAGASSATGSDCCDRRRSADRDRGRGARGERRGPQFWAATRPRRIGVHW